MNFDNLPKGWQVKRLGEVAKVFSGSSAPQGSQYFENGKYPFVRVQDVGLFGRTKNLTNTKDKINDEALKKFRLVLAKKGSIVFPKSGAAILTNNRAMLGVDAYVVGHLAIIEADEEQVSKDYLYHWLCNFDVASFVKTTSLPSLRLSLIKEFEIPCPPLPQQRRIVRRIEELTSRIEEAKGLRLAAQKETEAIMPAALHEIFGKAQLEWESVALGETIKLTSGRFLPAKQMQDGGPYPVYGGNGIVGYHTQYLFEESKVIIGRVGAKCGCVHITQSKSWITDNALYVTDKLKDIVDEYLALALRHLNLNQFAKQAAQPVISQKLIKPLKIPLPPSDEQRRIVAYLDRLQAKVEELRRLQEETQKEIEAMRAAVLTKAFAGEL
ncbi:MAG TPA: restriction endonuclease subunit S [Syntrophaceae bacterium]|nr:restriction endonuclease subunit S [Syntrophaceae bacterium]